MNEQKRVTKREASEVLGVLEKDNDWDSALEEDAQFRSPANITEFFSPFISACEFSNPTEMWKKYKNVLYEDI